MPVICCVHKQEQFPPTQVALDNYWVSNGTNWLKGCCGDPSHPIKLPDCFILHALQRVNRARLDFDRLYPALLPCEQERFNLLMERFPGLFKPIADPVLLDDARMVANIRAIPVHTSGPNGGLTAPIMCNQPMVQYNSGK